MKRSLRRNLIRAGLVLILIVLAVFLYRIGKEHAIFVDNVDFVTTGGQVLTAGHSYKVWIDGKELGLVNPGKRKGINLPRLNHRVVVEEQTPGGARIEKKFKLQPGDDAVINLPALVQGDPGWLRLE